MSNHLTPERLADIQGAQKEEWSIYPDDVDDLLAHIDAQAATIQRVRDLLAKEPTTDPLRGFAGLPDDMPSEGDLADFGRWSLAHELREALAGGQE